MILLRHGESEFNVVYNKTREDPGIRDPELTERGHKQAREASQKLAGHGVTRVLASPFTRTLQTAQALGLPTVIDPLVRERGAFACDIGTPASALMADWPDHDFSHMDELWWMEDRESEAEISARAALFRIAARDWADHHELVVVSHWGFILALTGQSVKNCEMVFYDPHEPEPA